MESDCLCGFVEDYVECFQMVGCQDVRSVLFGSFRVCLERVWSMPICRPQKGALELQSTQAKIHVLQTRNSRAGVQGSRQTAAGDCSQGEDDSGITIGA